LGHAYVVKRWGGDVHEIGLMFLVFMPVPYVDASDAMRFNSKWQRALVGAAGILVEGFLAALAMIIWVNAEDGFVRAIAFNTMLIGGVSTLLFNGNPLLKFDGYYVMSDLLEIPNLATRSKKYLGYLVKRYAFGMKHEQTPATGRGEPGWLAFYAIAAFIYRLFITFAIVMFVSTQFFILGILLAVWALGLMFGWPLLKMIWFLLANPGLRRHRSRAFAVTGAVLAVMGAALFAVPVPHATVAEGVIWVPGENIIHSEADGLVVAVAAQPGQQMQPGDPLVRLDDPLITARARMLGGYMDELDRRLAAQTFVDRSATRVLNEELTATRADLDITQARIENLVVRATAAGQLILPGADDLIGRFVRKGDVVGYVTDDTDPLIRVIVPESRSDLVRSETQGLHVRFASQTDQIAAGHIAREVPALTASLPSLALAAEGGGKIALDPTAPNQNQALSKLLHLDVRIDADTTYSRLGERVYVRFDHGKEPLAQQIYRMARQVFLRTFSI
jgi:putative peptide zinc metalloprotease protein